MTDCARSVFLWLHVQYAINMEVSVWIYIYIYMYSVMYIVSLSDDQIIF